MTVASQTPSAQNTKLPLRPRPQLGLGSALIGREEEELVLQVVRNQEPFRYYGHDTAHPPGMAATLEKEFAEKYGFQYALAVTSGTAALECALAALGVGPGDEVIVPAWSWISCFTAVVRVGAMPVLAEIDETFCLAPGEISRLATAKTKCVMVIHFQGVAADMEKLAAEAHSHGIKVLEDCAEAVGATYKGKSVGQIGEIAIFSFQYHKFMTSGEGGMVATNDPVLYERAVRFHDIGQVRPYHAAITKPAVPAFSGSQFRMTELCAAMALAQLRKVDFIKNHCRQMSARITEQLKDLKGLTPRRIPDPSGDTGFEIYLSLPTKELATQFSQKLEAMNVNAKKTTFTSCHYAREYCQTGAAHTPAASPFKQFKEWPAKGYRREDFPRTEAIVHTFLALPIGVKYTNEDADYIAAAVRQVHEELMG
ncbi:MAG: aminotransferase class V-fold PLP-dependent enzyme [Tepidisphaeraceae bacterium]